MAPTPIPSPASNAQDRATTSITTGRTAAETEKELRKWGVSSTSSSGFAIPGWVVSAAKAVCPTWCFGTARGPEISEKTARELGSAAVSGAIGAVASTARVDAKGDVYRGIGAAAADAAVTKLPPLELDTMSGVSSYELPITTTELNHETARLASELGLAVRKPATKAEEK